jgi:hypothetical protein
MVLEKIKIEFAMYIIKGLNFIRNTLKFFTLVYIIYEWIANCWVIFYNYIFN